MLCNDRWRHVSVKRFRRQEFDIPEPTAVTGTAFMSYSSYLTLSLPLGHHSYNVLGKALPTCLLEIVWRPAWSLTFHAISYWFFKTWSLRVWELFTYDLQKRHWAKCFPHFMFHICLFAKFAEHLRMSCLVNIKKRSFLTSCVFWSVSYYES